MYEKIQETASFIKGKMRTNPETAIILGSGLGRLTEEITDVYEIAYTDIPNFPVSTVEGHAGKLIFGKLGGKDILAASEEEFGDIVGFLPVDDTTDDTHGQKER
mgnify:CR=1 FL=1